MRCMKVEGHYVKLLTTNGVFIETDVHVLGLTLKG